METFFPSSFDFPLSFPPLSYLFTCCTTGHGSFFNLEKCEVVLAEFLQILFKISVLHPYF